MHAARRLTEVCRATGLPITQQLLGDWETEEVQAQLERAERAAEIERLRAAHLREIVRKKFPDERGEFRVFWSSREEARFALREWCRARSSVAKTQHGTLDELCSLTRGGEARLVKCGDGWLALGDAELKAKPLASGVYEVSRSKKKMLLDS